MDAELIMMTPRRSSTLSPELTGIWSSRVQSRYEQKLLRLLWILTSSILVIFFIETINHLALVPFAAFLISGIFLLILEIYTKRLPYIAILVSQGIIFVTATYIRLYTLFSQQSSFLDNPNFPLLPDLLGLVLGFIILIRICIGIELMWFYKCYERVRVPLSRYPKENLYSFETNLQLVSSEVQQEFIEESPIFRIRHLFIYIFLSVCLLVLLLLPLWINLLLGILIYPYILLIPGILVLLIVMAFFSPRFEKSKEEIRE